MSSSQMDLMAWDKPQKQPEWGTRRFKKDGAEIVVKLKTEKDYRGLQRVRFVCYDTSGKPTLNASHNVAAGWNEVQVYVDHWMPQLVLGNIPSGVPIYKLEEARN